MAQKQTYDKSTDRLLYLQTYIDLGDCPASIEHGWCCGFYYFNLKVRESVPF